MNLPHKLMTGAVVATPIVAAASRVALAEGVADAAVVSTFTGISENVVATMGAVAPFGIAILAIFLGFRYGKQIFTSLAGRR